MLYIWTSLNFSSSQEPAGGRNQSCTDNHVFAVKKKKKNKNKTTQYSRLNNGHNYVKIHPKLPAPVIYAPHLILMNLSLKKISIVIRVNFKLSEIVHDYYIGPTIILTSMSPYFPKTSPNKKRIFFSVKDRNLFHLVNTIEEINFDLSQKKKTTKYSVCFMLLTLSGRSFIKTKYSSFPLFPVAYPFRITTQLQCFVKREKCKVNDVIFPCGCKARAIYLGNKNMKSVFFFFTGGTSVRSTNIFSGISHEINLENSDRVL